MGNYVTGTEVYDLLVNQSVGVPTRLPPADLEPYIAGIEAQVDGVLKAQNYTTVPATGANDVAMIREHIRRKVAALVVTALIQPQRSPDWVRTWDIDFSEWLGSLRKGQLRLTDQSPGAPGSGPILRMRINLGLTEVEDT